jgi:uncharacterized membrane protein
MIPAIFLPFIILIIDLPWLMLTSTNAQKMIRSIQKSDLQIRILPAAVVYIALAYLVTLPKNPKDAFLLGLCTYAVYDFTNLATLKNYSLQFAILDSLWGGILFLIVHYIIKLYK